MQQVIKNIFEKTNNNKVVVACSTGIDSMTLLYLTMQAKDVDDIIVVHINHQKRNQSIEEETYIKEFCKQHNLKCYVKRLDKIEDGNFQALAREERYIFFDEIATKENAKYILLAHHADDNLETILMRMMKSSSLKGYAGVEMESIYKTHYIYRPLLKHSKLEITKYAKDNNIKYYEDVSNFNDEYTRNRIRKYITPVLLEENPKLYDAINYYSETILGANKLLEKEKLQFIENKILVNNNNDINTYQMNLSDYNSLDEYLKKQILFRLLKLFKLSHQCVEDIMKQLASSKPNIVTMVNDELAMIKEYGYVIFTNEVIKPLEYELIITQDGEYNLPNIGKLEVYKNNCNLITTKNKVCYTIKGLPIVVRTRRAGDKIKRKDCLKNISDYLTNQKIPYLIRKDLLYLYDNDNTAVAILNSK